MEKSSNTQEVLKFPSEHLTYNASTRGFKKLVKINDEGAKTNRFFVLL